MYAENKKIIQASSFFYNGVDNRCAIIAMLELLRLHDANSPGVIWHSRPGQDGSDFLYGGKGSEILKQCKFYTI
jgi:hypothetical protein